MIFRLQAHPLASFTKSTKKARRSSIPRSESLEDRALMTGFVDLGAFAGTPMNIWASQGSQVSGVNSTAELAGQKAAPGTEGTYLAFFLDNNGTYHNISPESGYTDSFATALNDEGQVAGYSQINIGTPANPSYSDEAFLYSQGTLQDLGTLGGKDSVATGINNQGMVVGYSTTSNGSVHAFLYSKGSMTDLGTLSGGTASYATGINNSGTVVGYSTTSSSNGSTDAFLVNPGSPMVDLGTLGGSGSSSQATGINDSGEVVGYSVTSPNTQEAFLWTKANGMVNLGTLAGFPDSYALAINNSGLIVGYVHTTANGGLPVDDPFMDSNGKMTDLNTLMPANSGWALNTATAISNQNVIVGLGMLNNILNPIHAYMLFYSPTSSPTPTPAPTPTPTRPPSPTPTPAPTPTPTPAPTPPPAAPPRAPGGPSAGIDATRIVLTAKPRPAKIGRPVTLNVNVQSKGHGGGAPTGTVTFWDDATNLGTASLVHGKAVLTTSSLTLGPNPIRVVYSGAQDYSASTATMVEKLVAPRSKSKAHSAALTAPHSSPVSRAAMIEFARESVAGPAEAMTLVATPTFLGPIALDRGDTARVHQGRKASAQLLSAPAVPVGSRRQTVNQSRPSAREERGGFLRSGATGDGAIG
jgi:probable HAF family extracellular repeat protein